MYQGEASTSAGKRPCGEASSSEDPSVPLRRGRSRRGGRGGREARAEPQREPEVEEGASTVPLEVVRPIGGRVSWSAWPHGPHLGAGFGGRLGLMVLIWVLDLVLVGQVPTLSWTRLATSRSGLCGKRQLAI